MIDTVDTTLDQRPEALNRVCVDITDDIDLGQVIDSFVPVEELGNRIIAREFVSNNGGVGGDIINQEWVDSLGFNIDLPP